MKKIKKFQIEIGITIFRYKFTIAFTPFIWWIPRIFINTKKAMSKHFLKAIFIGPFHIWTFDANDMFEISLDFNFHGLSYKPKSEGFLYRQIL